MRKHLSALGLALRIFPVSVRVVRAYAVGALATLALAGVLGIGFHLNLAWECPPSSLSCVVGRAPVYTLADVRRGLNREPAAWLRTPVLLRAMATSRFTRSCPLGLASCLVSTPLLVDPGTQSARGGLALEWGAAYPMAAALRRLPVLGLLVPLPQRPQWDRAAIYRVQIRRPSSRRCVTFYVAVLLDAAL